MNNNDDIEIVEFDKKEDLEVVELVDTKVENTLENRKDLRIVAVALAVIIGFVFIMPYVVGLFDTESTYNYEQNVDTDSDDGLINGLLQFGENNGSIEISDIKFYNALKRENSQISINYKADKNISDPSSLELYIQLFNSDEELIYQEKFSPSGTIGNSVVDVYYLTIDTTIYNNVKYINLVSLADVNTQVNNSVVCNMELSDTEFDVQSKVIYSFSDNNLVSYEVIKTASIKEDVEVENIEKYNIIYSLENDTLISSGLVDAIIDDNYLSYSVDYSLDDFDYLYNYFSLKQVVVSLEENSGWTCTDE